MKKEQDDYTRDYIHIPMKRNTAQHKSAPDFVAHSMTSKNLIDYVTYCVMNKKEIAFDFAINVKSEELLLIVMSVPFFEKRRPTNLEDFFA